MSNKKWKEISQEEYYSEVIKGYEKECSFIDYAGVRAGGYGEPTIVKDFKKDNKRLRFKRYKPFEAKKYEYKFYKK